MAQLKSVDPAKTSSNLRVKRSRPSSSSSSNDTTYSDIELSQIQRLLTTQNEQINPNKKHRHDFEAARTDAPLRQSSSNPPDHDKSNEMTCAAVKHSVTPPTNVGTPTREEHVPLDEEGTPQDPKNSTKSGPTKNFRGKYSNDRTAKTNQTTSREEHVSLAGNFPPDPGTSFPSNLSISQTNQNTSNESVSSNSSGKTPQNMLPHKTTQRMFKKKNNPPTETKSDPIITTTLRSGRVLGKQSKGGKVKKTVQFSPVVDNPQSSESNLSDITVCFQNQSNNPDRPMVAGIPYDEWLAGVASHTDTSATNTTPDRFIPQTHMKVWRQARHHLSNCLIARERANWIDTLLTEHLIPDWAKVKTVNPQFVTSDPAYNPFKDFTAEAAKALETERMGNLKDVLKRKADVDEKEAIPNIAILERMFGDDQVLYKRSIDFLAEVVGKDRARIRADLAMRTRGLRQQKQQQQQQRQQQQQQQQQNSTARPQGENAPSTSSNQATQSQSTTKRRRPRSRSRDPTRQQNPNWNQGFQTGRATGASNMQGGPTRQWANQTQRTPTYRGRGGRRFNPQRQMQQQQQQQQLVPMNQNPALAFFNMMGQAFMQFQNQYNQ